MLMLLASSGPGPQMWARQSLRLFIAALALAFVKGLPGFAQAPTATRAVRLQIFGSASVANTDYGTSKRNLGATAGADIDVNLPFHLKPGFEVRASSLAGDSSTLALFGGGPRVTLALHRFEPYAYGLLSGGTIHFHPVTDQAYTHDTSVVYAFGGGADMLLSNALSLRLDLQGQRWRFEPTAGTVLSRGCKCWHRLSLRK